MIDRLRELLRAATPGPWKVDTDVFEVDPPYNFTVCIDGSAGLLFTSDTDVVNEVTVKSTQRALDSQPGRDARLIVAAVNALPELLDAHDRMAGALAKAERLNAMLPDELTRLADLLEAKVPVPSNRTDYFEGWLDAVHAVQAELRSLRAALAVPKEENPE